MVFGFARFGYGKDDRVLPYCWEVGVLIGQVVEVSEILNTPWSQVFQLEDSDTICTWGSRVLAGLDGFEDVGWSERGGLVV